MINIETVKTDDFEMEYFRFGTGERTMVILPGLSVKSVIKSAEAIAMAFGRFKDEYTVYLFERVSHPREGYTVRDMADDTIIAMDSLGLSDVYLFGASTGPMIAMAIAVKRPDLIHKMVLGSTTARMTPSAENGLDMWIEAALSGDYDELNRRFAETVFSESFLTRYRRAVLAVLSGVTRDDAERFAVLANGLKGYDIYDELDKIKCPVLVIGAAQDKLLGIQPSIDLAEKLGCELYIYDGYGHAVYDEAPDYRDRIWGFFDKECVTEA